MLEGIAFQVADLAAATAADAGVELVELRADGGASVSDVLLQFQADILGMPVARAAEPESTALGAACLAGLAVGLWRRRRRGRGTVPAGPALRARSGDRPRAVAGALAGGGGGGPDVRSGRPLAREHLFEHAPEAEQRGLAVARVARAVHGRERGRLQRGKLPQEAVGLDRVRQVVA